MGKQTPRATMSTPAYKQSSECETYLVWVLDQYIFTLWHFHAKIGDGPHDAPSVGEGHVELGSKVRRTHRSSAQNDVPGVVAWIRPRDVSALITSNKDGTWR